MILATYSTRDLGVIQDRNESWKPDEPPLSCATQKFGTLDRANMIPASVVGRTVHMQGGTIHISQAVYRMQTVLVQPISQPVHLAAACPGTVFRSPDWDC